MDIKRTTIYLPDIMKVAIEREAVRRGVTEAEVIRAAVAGHLETGGPTPPEFPLFDTELEFDLAQRAEELLGQRDRDR